MALSVADLLSSRRVRMALCSLLLLVVFTSSYLATSGTDLPSHLEGWTYPDSRSSNLSESSSLPVLRPTTTSSTAKVTTSTSDPPVDWSKFAYIQYVTNENYLCNSLMILESLKHYKTKADLLMIYPQTWTVPADSGNDADFAGKMLAKARDEYGAKLRPIQVKHFNNGDPTWQDSYTKLLAWNQTGYDRIISLDSDATVLNHMDELFLLPPTPCAMPRAYWLDPPTLSSQLIVLQPSPDEWSRISRAIDNHGDSDYDMDILNKIYGRSALVIPARNYDLLSGEFRNEKHDKYLGTEGEPWSAKKALAEAKFLHFSDWPLPKPWISVDQLAWDKYQPECRTVEGKESCEDRDVWEEVRRDFGDRRERVCGRRFDGHLSGVQRRSRVRERYEPVFG